LKFFPACSLAFWGGHEHTVRAGTIKMPRGADISNVERNFVLEALTQGVRVSGRGLTDFRKVEVDFGDEYGNVTVRLGKTGSVLLLLKSRLWPRLMRPYRVLVQISAEITKPLDDRKFDGIFTISTELSPIASASFDVGR
jgi:exosome complex component RRP45